MQRFLMYLLVSFFLLQSCGKKEMPVTITHPVEKNKNPAKKKQVKIIRIAIAPYHEVDSTITALIADQFEAFYSNINTFILPKAVMDDSLLAHSKTRYNANKILAHLATIKPNESTYILAITDDKIAACGDSIHETGVAGLGDKPGYCCVVSTAAMKNKLRDSTQFGPRLIKACMHEMGHNFGLNHCKSKDKKCLMRSSGGTIVTLDEEEIYFCKTCRELLKKRGFIPKELIAMRDD
jgi:archaemetzincin